MKKVFGGPEGEDDGRCPIRDPYPVGLQGSRDGSRRGRSRPLGVVLGKVRDCKKDRGPLRDESSKKYPKTREGEIIGHRVRGSEGGTPV